MATPEFDCDPMGGLMPQILALTAPPGSQNTTVHPSTVSQTSTSQTNAVSHSSTAGVVVGAIPRAETGLAAHPYFRRPGRGHNHDCCDACSEGGDLICCDSCPASFHLTCHDPPLDIDDIPTGEWACHECRMNKVKVEQPLNEPAKSTARVSKLLKKKEEKRNENLHKVCAGGREMEVSDSPLLTLIKAAAMVNPTQFSLPYEMRLPVTFQGEPKDIVKRNGNRRGPPKKKPYELDNGRVSLPAKLCFQCSKSCRTGPLIPCDFCPLFFHLDCLDPPLTTPPLGRWMCPNHPQHILDTALLSSNSLTERVRLWDRCSGPVDSNTVTLNFLKKCHRTNPPFRYKVKRALRSRIKVPMSIRSHYNDPPDLLPHLSPSQFLPYPLPYGLQPNTTSQTSCLLPSSSVPVSCQPSPLSICSSSLTTCDRTSQAADALLQMNSATVSPLEDSDIKMITEPLLDADSVADTSKSKCLEVDEPRSNNSEMEIEDIKPEINTTGVGGLLEPEQNKSLSTEEERREWLASILCLQASIIKYMANPSSKPNDKDVSRENVTEEKLTNSLPHNSEVNLTKLSDAEEISSNMSKKNSLDCPVSNGYQLYKESRVSCFNGDIDLDPQIDPISKSEAKLKGAKYEHNIQSLHKRRGMVKSHRKKHLAEHLSSSSRRFVKRSPSDVLCSTLNNLSITLKERLKEKHEITLDSLENSVVEVLAYERLQQIMEPTPEPVYVNPGICARALLCPVSPDVRLKDWADPSPGSMEPVPMCYRVLSIGKGSSNHCDLEKYGSCNFISADHAKILFDQNTGHYELLNYSQYGTNVDGVLYNCDPSVRTISQSAPPPFVQLVKDMIAQKKSTRPPPKTPTSPAVMSSISLEDVRRCNCHRRKLLNALKSENEEMGVEECESSSKLKKSTRDVQYGWEGAAVLHHGSVIKFGCLRFVLSIVEEASRGDWCDQIENTYHNFIKKENLERERDRKSRKTKIKDEDDEEEEMEDIKEEQEIEEKEEEQIVTKEVKDEKEKKPKLKERERRDRECKEKEKKDPDKESKNKKERKGKAVKSSVS